MMQSDYPLTLISGDRPGVNGYYDLTPESPDGSRVVLFSFDRQPDEFGPGRLALTERSGRGLRLLGPPATGSCQNGVMQQWVDNGHVAAMADRSWSTRGTLVLPIDGGEPRQLEADIRMFNATTGKGLGFLKDPDHPNPRSVLFLMDFATGRSRRLFNLYEAAALHPVARRMSREQLHGFHMKHSKWAPDGSRFFCVLTNEPHRTMPRVKALMVANADGTGLHHHTEFGHHPLWGPDSSFVYAFERGAGGEQALMVYPLRGQPHAMVKNLRGVHPSLSPDGRWIVTDRWETARPDPAHNNASVVLIDPATGAERTLVSMRVADTNGQSGCHPHPVWDRQGRRVYFNTTDDGILRLWAVDIA